ncbi:MAG: MgtC/SapB family protein [Bacillota bacterium]|nr:MgtC/SapB family protein [Bacillota bacterium]
MFTLPDCFYDISIISITTRLFLAVILSGIIGLERGANRHPAGFRTHILVCVGAALAMMTNQYICEIFGSTDPARLGAQVITGVGFLGVGTILITGKNKIKGLTTAAGLWASACLGLALGIGFYSGAVIAAVIIFISLALLPKIENHFYRKSRVLELYIEVDNIENYKKVKMYIKSLSPTFYETHLSQTSPVLQGGIPVNISLILPAGGNRRDTINALEAMDGVYMLEEIS